MARSMAEMRSLWAEDSISLGFLKPNDKQRIIDKNLVSCVDMVRGPWIGLPRFSAINDRSDSSLRCLMRNVLTHQPGQGHSRVVHHAPFLWRSGRCTPSHGLLHAPKIRTPLITPLL